MRLLLTQKHFFKEETLLKTLKATRRGKLGSCTRKIYEIKTLLFDGGNVDIAEEGVETFIQAVDDLKRFSSFGAKAPIKGGQRGGACGLV